MTIEKFEQAKFLREQIDSVNVKMLQLRKMEKRENDKEFNLCRELASDGITYAKARLEDDFKNLQ